MSDSSTESGETALYEPIMRDLRTVIGGWYLEKEKKYIPQSRPNEFEENPRLEITAFRKISPTLQKEFDDETFLALGLVGKYPDIMGFVRRKASVRRELITVEVKNQPIKLMDIFQAQLYQVLFKARLGFLISPKGITEKIVRFITSSNYRFIRENVIILQYNKDHRNSTLGAHVGTFECNPKLRDVVPESLRKYFEAYDKK